jgi:protein tyrosine phosphatase
MIYRLTKKRNVNKSQTNVKSSNAKHQLTKKHITRKSQNRKTKLYKVRKGVKGFKGDKGKKTVQKGGLVCEQTEQPKKGFFKTIFGKKNKTDDYIQMSEDCFRNNLLEMLKTRKLIMLQFLNNRKTFLENKLEKTNADNKEISEIIQKLNNVDKLYIHPYDDLICRLYFRQPIKEKCYDKDTTPYEYIKKLLGITEFEKMGRMNRTYKNFIEEYQFLIDYENNKKLKDKIREQLTSVELYNDGYCYNLKNKNQVSPPHINRNFKPKTNTKDIKHIWFTNWPDHGVPKDMTLFHAFITYVYEDMKKGGNTVIHCSAGIGRTGVVYIVLFLLNNGYIPKLDKIKIKINTISNAKILNYEELYKKVNEARKHRFGLVQTKEQYDFIYNYFVNKLEPELQHNEKMTFSNLNKDCYKDINKKPTKVRYGDFLPCSEHVVELPLTTTTTTPTYIHASKMNPLQFGNKVVPIITTECPRQNNENFYTMLDSYDIERIIMVTGLVEKGKNKCDNYFNFPDPTTGSDNVKYNVKYNDNPITLTKSDDNSNDWGLIHTLSFTEKYPLKALETPNIDIDL